MLFRQINISAPKGKRKIGFIFRLFLIAKALATLYALYLFLNLIIILRIAAAFLRIRSERGNSVNNRKYAPKTNKVGIRPLGPIKSLTALMII